MYATTALIYFVTFQILTCSEKSAVAKSAGKTNKNLNQKSEVNIFENISPQLSSLPKIDL